MDASRKWNSRKVWTIQISFNQKAQSLISEHMHADIMIVPVGEESLRDVIEKGIYVCPDDYVKRNPKFLAFYLGKNIGAITHFAEVQNIRSQVSRNEVFKVKSKNSVPKWKKHRLYKIFRLDNVIELDKAIKREKMGIQGRMYVSFKTFHKAGSVRDLFTKI